MGLRSRAGSAFKDYGSSEQTQHYLSRLTTNSVGSPCFSEPGSGSGAFLLQTRAVRGGSGWIFDGGKRWISNSLEAGLFVVFASAGPSKGHGGITAFVVGRESPGPKIGKKQDKLGSRASFA